MATNKDAQLNIEVNIGDSVGKLNDLSTALKNLNSSFGSFSGKVKTMDGSVISESLKGFAELGDKIKNIDFSTLAEGLNKVNTDFKKSTKEAVEAEKGKVSVLKEEQRLLESMAKTHADLTARIKEEKDMMKVATEGLFTRERDMTIARHPLMSRMRNSFIYNAGGAMFSDVRNGLMEGLHSIVDYEQGIVDLRRTLDSTEPTLRNFGLAAIQNAKDFGISIKETQSAMTELARAGASEEVIPSVTKDVLMGFNTTELQSTEEVVSALVSTTKQLKMQWKDTGLILDSWNMLADRYAVHTDDFAHAIERSGSASKMLGMDLYDLNAVVTILGESTQASGKEVGTAIRALSARLLRAGTIKKLEEYGIKVKKNNGEFLHFRDIMKNINEVIKDLPENSVKLSEIMDAIGGSWRKNWISALTKDFGRFDSLVKEQANNVGYSAKENEKAMDTISKKWERLKQVLSEGFIDIGKDGGGINGIKSYLDTTTNALEKFINSPTLRSVGKFFTQYPFITSMLFGVNALGKKVVGGYQGFGNATVVGLNRIGELLNKRTDKAGTLGSFLSGIQTGEQKRVIRGNKIFEQLRADLGLGYHQMGEFAKRIDAQYGTRIFKSLDYKSELEKLKQVRMVAIKDFKETAAKNKIDITGFDFENPSKIKGYEEFTGQLKENKKAIVEVESKMKRLNEAYITAEKGARKLNAAFARDSIKNFGKSILSTTAQIAALTLAIQGVDWLINHKEREKQRLAENNNRYEEEQTRIHQQYKDVLKNEKNMNQIGQYVNREGKNVGANDMEYAQFMQQINQLKDISPEVKKAIEESVEKLNNFSGAAEAAKDALRRMEMEAARKAYEEDNDSIMHNLHSYFKGDGTSMAEDFNKSFKNTYKNYGGKNWGYGDLHGKELPADPLGEIKTDADLLKFLNNYTVNYNKIKKRLIDSGYKEKDLEAAFKKISQYKDEDSERRAEMLHTVERIYKMNIDTLTKVRTLFDNKGLKLDSTIGRLRGLSNTSFNPDALTKLTKSFSEDETGEVALRFDEISKLAPQRTTGELAKSMAKFRDILEREGLSSKEIQDNLDSIIREKFGLSFDSNMIFDKKSLEQMFDKYGVKKGFDMNLKTITEEQVKALDNYISLIDKASDKQKELLNNAMSDGLFKGMDFTKMGEFWDNVYSSTDQQVEQLLSSLKRMINSKDFNIFDSLLKKSNFSGDTKAQFATILSEMFKGGEIALPNIADNLVKSLHIEDSSLKQKLADTLSSIFNDATGNNIKLKFDGDTFSVEKVVGDAQKKAQNAADENPVKVDAKAKEGAGESAGKEIASQAQESADSAKPEITFTSKVTKPKNFEEVLNAQASIQSLLSPISPLGGSAETPLFNQLDKFIEYANSQKVEVKVTAKIDDGDNTIDSFVENVKSKLETVKSVVEDALSSVRGISSGIHGSVSKSREIGSNVSTALAKIKELKKATSQNFNVKVKVNTGNVNINGLSKSFITEQARIQSAMNRIVSIVRNGISRVKASWEGAKIGHPHIPVPVFNVSGGFNPKTGGVPHYYVTWHAKGAIIPATPGGRIVGVAEGGEAEAIIPLSKLDRLVKNSMTDVLKDSLSDFNAAFARSLNDFQINVNVRAGDYYSAGFKNPLLKLDDDSKSVINQFNHKKITVEGGYDLKMIDSVIRNMTRESSGIVNQRNNLKDMISDAEAYGNKLEVQKLKAKDMLLALTERNARIREATSLEVEYGNILKRSKEDMNQYLDENRDFNYLYEKKINSFGKGNEKAKEAFEGIARALQRVAKEYDNVRKKAQDTAREIVKQQNEIATNYFKANAERSYENERKYYEYQKERLERELKNQEKTYERERRVLEAQRDEIEKSSSKRIKDLDKKIQEIRDEGKEQRDKDRLTKLEKALKKAQDKYDKVKDNKDVRVYTIDSNGNWQYDYQIDQDKVDSALDELKKAQEDYDNYFKEKQIQKLEDEKKGLDEGRNLQLEAINDRLKTLERENDLAREDYQERLDMIQTYMDSAKEKYDSFLKVLPELVLRFRKNLESVLNFNQNDIANYYSVISGNMNEEFNPLSILAPNQYAKSLMGNGVDLEKLTNDLLAVTRNPSGHSIFDVVRAAKELTKLGTIGEHDISSIIPDNDAVQYAMRKAGNVKDKSTFFSQQMMRVGKARPDGTIVTPEDMARYMRMLGIDVNAMQISKAKSSMERQYYNDDGTSKYGYDDIFKGFGGRFDKAETNDIVSQIMKSNNLMGEANRMMIKDSIEKESMRNQIGVSSSYLLNIAQNTGTILGSIDANRYYQQNRMSNGLSHAMNANGKNNVNDFIFSQWSRIGSVRGAEFGSKAGTVVTREDMYRWFASLGMSKELVDTTLNTRGIIASNNMINRENKEMHRERQRTDEEIIQTGKRVGYTWEKSNSLVNSLSNDLIMNTTEQRNLIDALRNYRPSGGGSSSSGSSSGGSSSGGSSSSGSGSSSGGSGSSSSNIDKNQDSKERQRANIESNLRTSLNRISGKDLDYAVSKNHFSSVYDFVMYQVGRTDKSYYAIEDYLQSIGIPRDLIKTAKHLHDGYYDGYSKGGVVDFTGRAALHGSPNAPEVVFNATDAKKLYDIVHNLNFMNINRNSLPPLPLELLNFLSEKNTNNNRSVVIENIQMDFPNATDKDEIQEALLTLPHNIELYGGM